MDWSADDRWWLEAMQLKLRLDESSVPPSRRCIQASQVHCDNALPPSQPAAASVNKRRIVVAVVCRWLFVDVGDRWSQPKFSTTITVADVEKL